MARGKDTMVRENDREEITVSDGLQLGRTTIDQTEIHTAEDEVDQLKKQNAKVSISGLASRGCRERSHACAIRYAYSSFTESCTGPCRRTWNCTSCRERWLQERKLA